MTPAVPPEIALRTLIRKVERALRVHLPSGRSVPSAAREDLERAVVEARRCAGMRPTDR